MAQQTPHSRIFIGLRKLDSNFSVEELKLIITSREAGDHPAIPAGDVQRALESANSDAMLLYDCCFGGEAPKTIQRRSSQGRSVTDLISACGFETSAYCNENSFTKILVRCLEAASKENKPLAVVSLHRAMLSEPKKSDKK
jgi:hypothetical protein